MKSALEQAIKHYEEQSLNGSNQAYIVADYLKKNFLPIEKNENRETQVLITQLIMLINNAKKHYGIICLTSNQQVEQLNSIEEIIKKAEQYLSK